MRQRNLRRQERVFVIEGAHLLEEALAARADIEGVYCSPEAALDRECGPILERASQRGLRVIPLEAGVLERVSDTVNPQPVIAIARFCDVALNELVRDDHLVICIDVRDPGNLGSIIRSADAAGIDAVVMSQTSADCYNPKCVRASAGSLFRIPIVLGDDSTQLLTDVGATGHRRLAMVPSGGRDYATADLSGKVALVLGNEAQGLSTELSAVLDDSVTIPMPGDTESLNVAMAATVLMFELARRQRLGPEATTI